MVNIIHAPRKDANNNYLISGDNISEIVEFSLLSIRVQSQQSYKEEIEADLTKTGKSGIDRHAGMGIYYDIKLITKHNNDTN